MFLYRFYIVISSAKILGMKVHHVASTDILDFHSFFISIPVAEPRPICPFWATVYGRNLSGFGGITGFDFFFRFAEMRGGPSVSFFVFIFQHAFICGCAIHLCLIFSLNPRLLKRKLNYRYLNCIYVPILFKLT